MARTPVTTLNFTAADGTNLETVNSSFVQIQSGQGAGYLTVLSNTLRQAFGDGSRFVYRDGTPTYSADQYASAVVSGLTNNNGNIGVVVRCNSDTNANADFYFVLIASGASPKETTLGRINNNSFTSLDVRTSITWADGDTIELEAITNGANCDLKVYKNGSLQYTYSDTSPLSSGKPGIYFQNASSNQVFMDDWEGGDVTASTDYTLTCDFGSYSLTGQDVTLTFVRDPIDFTLACDFGTYSLTGQDATLTFTPTGTTSYTLTCDYGVYTITGSDSFAATSVSLESGTYALSGQDVTFSFVQGTQNYSLTCEHGTYTLAGRSANLLWSGASASGGGGKRLGLTTMRMGL